MDSFLKIYIVGWLVNSRTPVPKEGRNPVTYYTVAFMGGNLEFGIVGGDSSVDALVQSGRRVQVLVPAMTRASVRTFDGQSFASSQIVPCIGGVEVKPLD